MLPTIGSLHIEQVGPRDIQRLVNTWRTTHAPRTVKRNYEVVRAMFGYAVRNDWITRNPCRNVNLPTVDGTRRFDLTPENVAAMAAHVPDEYQPMLWLGAVLGLRWSEVAGLRIGRIDLHAGRLSVAEALVRGTGGRNVFGPPKSKAGQRTMFMPHAIGAMLSAHLERSGFTWDESDELVFTDEEGGPLRYSNWRRRVWLPAAAAAAAGCAGAGFHDLRRLNATTLVVEGIDVKTAQTRLGHADPRTTLADLRLGSGVNRSGRSRRSLASASSAENERASGEPEEPEKSPRHFRANCSRASRSTHRRQRPEQGLVESGCPDLNRGPLRPERSALTKLRHSPFAPRGKRRPPYPGSAAGFSGG